MKKPFTGRHRCLSLRESSATFAERKATLCRQSPANCQRPVNGYGEGLTWADTHYDSIHGKIVSNWKREGDKLTMEVTIPANTTATVHVPAKDAAAVTEAGNAIDKAQGVKFLRMENNAAVYAMGSGTYRFQSPLAETIQ